MKPDPRMSSLFNPLKGIADLVAGAYKQGRLFAILLETAARSAAYEFL